jgi:hypothetical protein
MSKPYQSFEEFWPFYLSQHSNDICRRLHVVGTLLGLVWLGLCLYRQTYTLVPLAPLIGYGFAWTGHFGFEKNKPATFKYPRWSFIADFKMMFLFFSGGLERELVRHGIKGAPSGV